MIENLVKSIKANLYDRATSPLFGTIAISWVLWNYRLVITLFSSMQLEDKFTYIDGVLYDGFHAKYCVLYVYPLLTAAFLIFVYPYPAKCVFEFWRNRQKELKEIKQKIEDETPLTIEESKLLRRQLIDVQLKHDMQLRQQSEGVEYLKQELEEAQKKTDELQKESLERNMSILKSNLSVPDQEIESVILGNKFRLVYNPSHPQNSSKVITFNPNGKIVEGKNMNENSWRIKNGMLELLDENGVVHSRFHYHPQSRIFTRTNDPDMRSIKGQYIMPEQGTTPNSV